MLGKLSSLVQIDSVGYMKSMFLFLLCSILANACWESARGPDSLDVV